MIEFLLQETFSLKGLLNVTKQNLSLQVKHFGGYSGGYQYNDCFEDRYHLFHPKYYESLTFKLHLTVYTRLSHRRLNAAKCLYHSFTYYQQ